MLQMIVAHGGSGPEALAPLFMPLFFGGMLWYFIKKNPAQRQDR